jgi:cytochrome c peroxidase
VVAGLLFVAAVAAYEWALPAGFPRPVVPPDNPVSVARVAFGETLFSDPRLSLTGGYSCASCHDPARAFTDGRARAIGATGQAHARNTPTLINAAYAPSFGWLETGPRSLEAQIRVALEGNDPIELGFDHVAEERLAALRADEAFATAYVRAFGLPVESLGTEHLVMALASYVRTLVFADSPFDRYVYWGDDTLSARAHAGMTLYLSARLGCSGCHGGFALAGPAVSVEAPAAAPVFHDGVRAPALRNVARTAPYMHDGALATLDDVLAFYAETGRGRPLRLDDRERAALRAFLESLTDRRWQ